MGQGIEGAVDFTREVVDEGLKVQREAFFVVTEFRYPYIVVRVWGPCRARERAVHGRMVAGRLGPGGS